LTHFPYKRDAYSTGRYFSALGSGIMAARRIATVTGAAQGIGRAIALRLADDGLDVVAFDLPSKANKLATLVQDITSRKRRGLAVMGDATKESDIQNLVNTAADTLGGLDVVRSVQFAAYCVQ
jgi:meso-butanediol dehydrogenase / (S,S)-butanediol dehydrogenase / diacetyl reductase